MKAALRATAMLSGTSAITIVAGLVSTKIRAELIGPDGVALTALLTAAIGLIMIPATLGIGPAVVRELAGATGAGDLEAAAAVRSAAWRIRLLMVVAAVAFIVIARVPLSHLLLNGVANTDALLTITAAVALMLITDLQISILNGYHKVSTLARVSALSAVCGSAASVSVIVVFGLRGVAGAIVASSVVAAGITFVYVLREAPRLTPGRSGDLIRSHAKKVLRFGAPYTLSSAVGTGAMTLVPILVLHQLGVRNVAYYQAASIIATTYLGFLINAMALDYFPRVAANRLDGPVLASLIQQQITIVLVISVPLILGTFAIAPYLVSAAYTPAFRPAAATLDWQLFADLFKFVSWTMAFVILARRGSGLYLFIETVGGGMLIASTFAGARVFGLSGIGIGYLATYIVYGALVFVIVRRDLGFRPTARNARYFAAAVAALSVMEVVAHIASGPLRALIGGAMTIAAARYSVMVLQAELGLTWREFLRGRRRPIAG